MYKIFNLTGKKTLKNLDTAAAPFLITELQILFHRSIFLIQNRSVQILATLRNKDGAYADQGKLLKRKLSFSLRIKKNHFEVVGRTQIF